MIVLDMDEPLWHRSRYGCTHRDKRAAQCPLCPKCEAREFCVGGRIRLENVWVDLGTEPLARVHGNQRVSAFRTPHVSGRLACDTQDLTHQHRSLLMGGSR